MHSRRREDSILTLICFSVSGTALILGMWIAISPSGASPLSATPAAALTRSAAADIVLAEAR